ncbi:MAG TPA: L-2-hydroxyglutarate oxidase [Egibacteraceae bacterium]|nr:L-2-hydroxyglutarate oxidase [Egibacteraceae bacterium]
MTDRRIAVVGGGILGLAVARRLTQVLPGAQITVLEKEQDLATHQTGRNSGVVHAGLYYQPGSLKAQLCRRGVGMLKEFCAEHSVPYQEVGKLVVALHRDELGRLGDIADRAELNGVPDLRMVDGGGITDIEPHAVGVAALHSPHTAIVDFVAAAEAMASEILAAGGIVRRGFCVRSVERAGERVRIAGGHEQLEFDQLIVCAGLHSDIVARLAGDGDDPRIIPFRGEYYRLRDDRASLVKGLIYPVPDPRYPFLGVHLTRRFDGRVDLGPNAVLALAREGYRWRDVRAGEVREILAWPGFRALARRHWRTGVKELAGSLSKRLFVREARRYVPALSHRDVVPAPAGVRAQAVARDGSLVDDFRINRLGPVVAIRNAPSSGATSSLAIAEHVCDQLLDRRGP